MGWSKPPNTADSAATLGAIYPFSANDELGKLALIGSFLGVGGVQVSDTEKANLADISNVLGTGA
jgi:hypothetical protein